MVYGSREKGGGGMGDVRQTALAGWAERGGNVRASGWGVGGRGGAGGGRVHSFHAYQKP